ncbi:MAG: chemotaxis protein CheW [Epsilonproteobacteria bacterium]|nr:chemotaxis protein CheW [Campylobacterota bacterium]
MQVIVFSLNNNLYGIELVRVKGISVFERMIITHLYHEKDFVLGLTNFRGEVVAIIDLRIKFKLNTTYDDNTVVLFVKTNENKIFGLVADSIKGIVDIKEKDIQNSIDTAEIDRKYLKGLFQLSEDEMVIMLNIDRLLAIEEF